jgi:hypothetical protein
MLATLFTSVCLAGCVPPCSALEDGCEECESADDCASGICENGDCVDGQVGASPVVNSVAICEVPASNDYCVAQGYSPGSFQVEFGLNISDVDGDLNNPQYHLIIDLPPALSGWIEQDMGEGGLLRVRVCNDWVRGGSFDYQVWVLDAAHNESERAIGTWSIPLQSGDNDCDPSPVG